MSGKCSARCSRSDVADPAPLVGGGEAEAREQLLLARDRLGAGDLPAHGEALEQELDGALPRVLAGRGCCRPRPSAYCARVAGVSAPRSTSSEPCSSRYSLSGARMRSRRRPFFAIAGTVACRPMRAQADPTARVRPRRARAARRLAPAAAARPARRAALQRVGAAGRRRDRARRHRHARPRLDGQPRARARPDRPPGRGRPPGRHHPRPHRPLRAGAADRRARRLRGLDAPALDAARRAPPDLDRTIEVALQSGVPEEPLRRWAERRARPRAAGQAGTLHADRDLVPGVVVETDLGAVAGGRDARPRAVARLPAPARAAPADLRRPPARPRLAVLRRRLHARPGRRVPALARRRRRARRPARAGRPRAAVHRRRRATSRPTAS